MFINNSEVQIATPSDSLTKEESSNFTHKPKPKPRKLKAVNMDIVSTGKNDLEKNLLVRHNKQVLEKSAMHGEHQTSIGGNFQSNT